MRPTSTVIIVFFSSSAKRCEIAHHYFLTCEPVSGCNKALAVPVELPNSVLKRLRVLYNR